MDFLAEVKRTTQIKKASLDNEYQLLLITDNPLILDLGKLPADTRIKVTIEIDNDN